MERNVPKNRHCGGFSLLEVVFSMVIISVSVLGLLALTTTSMKANARDDLKTGAVRLASQVAETLLAQPMEAVPAGVCGIGDAITSANAQPLSGVAKIGGNTVTTDTYVYDSTNDCLGSNFEAYPNPEQVIRKGTVDYNIIWTSTDLSSDLKMIQIDVYYPNPGETCLPAEGWKGCGVNTVTLYKHRAI